MSTYQHIDPFLNSRSLPYHLNFLKIAQGLMGMMKVAVIYMKECGKNGDSGLGGSG
ncbi:MAG: hypothetical protein V3U04_06835 [Candidatus Aerophobetes bacterium]